MRQFIKRIVRSFGYDVVRWRGPDRSRLVVLADLSEAEQEIVTRVQPFTLTSLANIASLLNAVNYITANKIPGDMAECGVWRGGSMMTIALALLAHNDTSRTLYLYDTFEGMPPPTDKDVDMTGDPAQAQLDRTPEGQAVWCRASLEDARANLLSTGYPPEKIRFVKGKVEDTIPGTIPAHLAILRLDTDWYESTRHELKHLFPLLDPKGILVLDDYGHWRGNRQAVDEYFREQNCPVFLHRIDYTARIVVGTGSRTH